MAERTDCIWRHDSISEPICHICMGFIVQGKAQHCPFKLGGEPKPEFQHLITADERLYSIQLKAKRGV